MAATWPGLKDSRNVRDCPASETCTLECANRRHRSGLVGSNMCGLGDNQSAQARMSHYVGLELNSGHRLLPVACMGSLLGLRGCLLAQFARPAPRDGHYRSAFAWLCVNSGPAPLFCLPTAGSRLTESRSFAGFTLNSQVHGKARSCNCSLSGASVTRQSVSQCTTY